jgi:hypothetical protein
MRTFAKSQIRYSKSQRMGIFALLGLIVCIEVTSFFIHQSKEYNPQTEIPPELLSLQNQIDQKTTTTSLQKFNPNALTSEGWKELGFSEKQVATIFKYKNSLGGNFSTKEEIKNCFVISEAKFLELEPYIEIEYIAQNSRNNTYSSSNSYENLYKKDKPKIHYSKFNPNDYSEIDWQRIGFSENQAQSILKYKRSLGGMFTTLEQIRASYVISEDKFQEMKPYILLPKEELLKSETFTKETSPTRSEQNLEKFNPNDLTREQWMDLGFSEKQVNTILNYKKSLGGKFKNAEILRKCYSISDEKFQELEPFLVFE